MTATPDIKTPDSPGIRESRDPPVAPALEVEDLRKTYKGGEEALKGVSLKVNPGDFFALLGSNGAGKSTLIGVISSMVEKTSGRVRIHGVDIDKKFHIARASMGLVPQEANFNQFRVVREALAIQAGFYGMNARTARARSKHYLKKLGLWDKRRDQVRSLSGGMKRRLMIVRALIHGPRLLVLDEPTVGSDVEVRHIIWELLADLNRTGMTIIMTTHYLEEAEKLCRNIAVINQGRIVQHATMNAFLGQLESENLVLHLEHPLDGAPQLKSAQQARLLDKQTLEVEIHHRGNLNDVFRELDALGVRVQRMSNKSNRLERLLLGLVGGKSDAS